MRADVEGGQMEVPTQSHLPLHLRQGARAWAPPCFLLMLSR